jgi:peroxiredoxin Q/BCP
MNRRFLTALLVISFLGCGPKKVQDPPREPMTQNHAQDQANDQAMAQLQEQLAALSEQLSALRSELEAMKVAPVPPPAAEPRRVIHETPVVEPALNEAPSTGPPTTPRAPMPEPTPKSLLEIKPEAAFTHRPYRPRERKDAKRIENELLTGTTLEKKFLRQDLMDVTLPPFRLIGSDGRVFDPASLKGKKNLLLVFLRGFSGQVCIACSTQTSALAKMADRFEALQTQILLVYPGPAASLPAFLKAVSDLDAATTLPFPLLLDPELLATKRLGIEGSLALPTSILVDRQGIVRFAYAGKRYDDRPPIRVLLEQAKAINHP